MALFTTYNKNYLKHKEDISIIMVKSGNQERRNALSNT